MGANFTACKAGLRGWTLVPGVCLCGGDRDPERVDEAGLESGVWSCARGLEIGRAAGTGKADINNSYNWILHTTAVYESETLDFIERHTRRCSGSSMLGCKVVHRSRLQPSSHKHLEMPWKHAVHIQYPKATCTQPSIQNLCIVPRKALIRTCCDISSPAYPHMLLELPAQVSIRR